MARDNRLWWPALVSAMHRDLVADRGWIVEADYRQGMALSQLAPGLLAAQLAIYPGYVHYGVWGATLTGLAFVLPAFLMVLGWLYVRFGACPGYRPCFTASGPRLLTILPISKLTTFV